jgi:signal transduction histidine kinase
MQGRLANELRDTTLAAWELDARTANAAAGARPGGRGRSARALRAPAADRPVAMGLEVDPAARREVERRSARTVRMLAFEGPFFALVILGLLLFIAGSLRAERELKRRQANFLSAVTHEFKTPISTLRLLVQTLRLRPLGATRQQDYLRRMEGEIDRLERTSEQVLATARLEQASAPPPLAAAELNQVVQGWIGRLRPGLEVRGADLACVTAPSRSRSPSTATPSAWRSRTCSTTRSSTRPGDDKRVSVTLERDGDLVVLHVDDEGVGVAPSERARVFERFYRTGDEMTRESEGVGLGLALVKSTVEAMRGWVKVADGPSGRGTRFTVVLPRRVALAESDERGDDATGQRSGARSAAGARRERARDGAGDRGRARVGQRAGRQPRGRGLRGALVARRPRRRAALDRRQRGPARPGGARRDAPQARRLRLVRAHAGAGRRHAGAVPLGARPGRGPCARPARRGRRLPRQAVPPAGVPPAGARDAAPARLAGRRRGPLRLRRDRHRLPLVDGRDALRRARGAGRARARDPAAAHLARRRGGAARRHPRRGLGRRRLPVEPHGRQRGRAAAAHHRERPVQPGAHPHRVGRRLPLHARTGDRGRHRARIRP